ncbi:MAG: branched-chain amino acid ABC transporter permease [Oligoflexia bacterium]|nr:branched-chain amino acid ABC transporter permease [Oligoflexia bacterium]
MDILPQLLINALITGSIYALASAGLALCYGVLRILNFAHGHLMMTGVYLFYLFSVTLGLALLPAALSTALAVAAVGAVSFTVFVRPFTRHNPVLPLVTTLALSTVLESSVAMAFGVNVKSLNTEMVSSLEIYGIFITPLQIGIIISALLLLGLTGLVIHFTPAGRTLRALAENEEAAQSLGIGSDRIRFLVFLISALMAAYAGIMLGYETNLQPTMGNSYTIKAFAAMVLGGLGNIWGTVAGAYLLGLVENLSIGLDFGGYSLPAGYRDAFAFMAILLMLLVRPSGLFRRAARRL